MSVNKFLESSVTANVVGVLAKEKQKISKKNQVKKEAFLRRVADEVYWINETRKLIKEASLSDESEYDFDARSRGASEEAPAGDVDPSELEGHQTVVAPTKSQRRRKDGNRITKSDFKKYVNLRFEKIKEDMPESWAKIEAMEPKARAIWEKNMAEKIAKEKGFVVVRDEVSGRSLSKLSDESRNSVKSFAKKVFSKVASSAAGGQPIPSSLKKLAQALFGIDLTKGHKEAGQFSRYVQSDGSVSPEALEKFSAGAMDKIATSPDLQKFFASTLELYPTDMEREVEEEAQAKNLPVGKPGVGQVSSRVGRDLYKSGVSNALGQNERIAKAGLGDAPALSEEEEERLKTIKSFSDKPFRIQKSSIRQSRLLNVDSKISSVTKKIQSLEKSLETVYKSMESPTADQQGLERRAKEILGHIDNRKEEFEDLKNHRADIEKKLEGADDNDTEYGPLGQEDISLLKKKSDWERAQALKKQEEENLALRSVPLQKSMEQHQKELSPSELSAKLVSIAQSSKVKMTPEVHSKMDELADAIVSRRDIGRTKVLNILDNIDIEKVLKHWDYFVSNPEEIERAKKNKFAEPSALQGSVEEPSLKSMFGSETEESLFKPELDKAKAEKKKLATKASEKSSKAYDAQISDLESKLKSTADLDQRSNIQSELDDLKAKKKADSSDFKDPEVDLSKFDEKDALKRLFDFSTPSRSVKKIEALKSEKDAPPSQEELYRKEDLEFERDEKIAPIKKELERVKSQIDQVRGSTVGNHSEKINKINNLKFDADILVRKIEDVKKDYAQKLAPSKEELRKKLNIDSEIESLDSPKGLQDRVASELANTANREDEKKSFLRSEIEAMKGGHPIEIKQLQGDIKRIESELEEFAKKGTPRHTKLTQELQDKKEQLAKMKPVKPASPGVESSAQDLLSKLRGPKELKTKEDVVDITRKLRDPITGKMKDPEKLAKSGELSPDQFSLAKLIATAASEKNLNVKDQAKKPEHLRPSKAIEDLVSAEKEKAIPSKDSPLTNVQAKKDYEGELRKAEIARKKKKDDDISALKLRDMTGVTTPDQDRDKELQQALKIAQYDMDVRNKERLAAKVAPLDDKIAKVGKKEADPETLQKLEDLEKERARYSDPKVISKGLPRVGQPYYGAGGNRLADLLKMDTQDKKFARMAKQKRAQSVDPDLLRKMQKNVPGVYESLLKPDGKDKEVEPTKDWDKAKPAKKMKLSLVELLKRGLLK